MTYSDVKPPVLTIEEAVKAKMIFPDVAKEIVVGDAEGMSCITGISFSGHLFRRKSHAVVITRMSLSCSDFNVAHYSKTIKSINTKLGILADHDKVQLKDKGKLYFCSYAPFKLNN